GNVEVRQEINVGIDLGHRQIQLRLAGHDTRLVEPAVVQMNAQIGRGQNVIVGSENVAFVRNQDTGAVRRQPFEPAGAEELDELLVDLGRGGGERLLSKSDGSARQGDQRQS